MLTIKEKTLTDIADAIRAKTGNTDEMTPAQMAEQIESIETGSGAPEHYVEETHDSKGNIVAVKMVGISNVRSYMFYSCGVMETVEFSEEATKINNNAFYYCNALPSVEIPANVEKIEYRAFGYCEGLISVTFKGTPKKIDSSAFYSDYAITTINVPWAEGEVANAPWGTTNATINYNYTEDAE